MRLEGQPPRSEASVRVQVDGVIEHTAAIGNGPVSALDHALRKALGKFYPEISEVRLIDYKVRVLSSGAGTDAAVRVLVDSGDADSHWGTVGVGTNVIDASYEALTDALIHKLARSRKAAAGDGARAHG